MIEAQPGTHVKDAVVVPHRLVDEEQRVRRKRPRADEREAGRGYHVEVVRIARHPSNTATTGEGVRPERNRIDVRTKRDVELPERAHRDRQAIGKRNLRPEQRVHRHLLSGETFEAVETHSNTAEEGVAAEAVTSASAVGTICHGAASQEAIVRAATELRAAHARLRVGSRRGKDQNCKCTKNLFHAPCIGVARPESILPGFFVRRRAHCHASARIRGPSCAQPRKCNHPRRSTAIELHRIAEIFDARAARYAHDDWHRRYAEQLVDITPLQPGNRVLDAGTGTGFAACAIARRIEPQGRVLAIDVSSQMLEEARVAVTAAQLSNIDLIQGDATELRHLGEASFDAVICAAGLLYMPVAKALREWARLLRTDGVVAFSTMRTGSPSAGRLFRQCAARFGLELDDPSAALGTAERCRHALEDAGFTSVEVTPGRVDFESLDPTLAWEANVRAADVKRQLSDEQLHTLREQFLAALSRAMQEDLAASARADVLYAVARRRR